MGPKAAMKWLVDLTTTMRRARGSMPRLVNSSSPSACVRLVISTTSTPPTRTQAQSPSGTCVGPKLCQQSCARPVDATVRVTGLAPDCWQSFGPTQVPLGDCACVRVGGIEVVLITNRTQALGLELFRNVGV